MPALQCYTVYAAFVANIANIANPTVVSYTAKAPAWSAVRNVPLGRPFSHLSPSRIHYGRSDEVVMVLAGLRLPWGWDLVSRTLQQVSCERQQARPDGTPAHPPQRERVRERE
ncbi:hypothetical protein AOLI_G00199720 [Acnodon oligacanthus]